MRPHIIDSDNKIVLYRSENLEAQCTDYSMSAQRPLCDNGYNSPHNRLLSAVIGSKSLPPPIGKSP